MRPGLRFLWERPVLGAALVSLLQTGLLDMVLGVVANRGFLGWFGWFVYGLSFFIVNVFAAFRERRRRRRSEASQQSV